MSLSPPILPQAITPRGIEIDVTAGAPFEALRVARDLLHQTGVAAMSTTDPGGFPYGTITNIVPGPDGCPIFFAAWLTLHARNLAEDARIALTLAAFGRADVLTRPRLTLVGRASRLSGAPALAARRRYLARFPKAKLYLSLPDAILYRMEIADLQINGGPGRNASRVTAAALGVDLAGAEPLLAAEEAILDRLNAARGLPARLAAAAGGGAGRWRVTGIDPEGLDLAAGDLLLRLWSDRRLLSPADLDAWLARLAD